jgi:hypothetical protein
VPDLSITASVQNTGAKKRPEAFRERDAMLLPGALSAFEAARAW